MLLTQEIWCSHSVRQGTLLVYSVPPREAVVSICKHPEIVIVVQATTGSPNSGTARGLGVQEEVPFPEPYKVIGSCSA